jgi:ABC-type branched-subunit amino acid transport system substrate-binding protein
LLYGVSALYFDAVYSIANAITALHNQGIDPNNGTALLQTILTQNVTGSSGLITFDENGDRVGNYLIMNHRSGANNNQTGPLFGPPLSVSFARIA